jgi:hypothetical protein
VQQINSRDMAILFCAERLMSKKVSWDRSWNCSRTSVAAEAHRQWLGEICLLGAREAPPRMAKCPEARPGRPTVQRGDCQ